MLKNSSLWLLIVAVFLLSIQILAMVIYIYSFIPFPAYWSDPFSKGVEPNRDVLFYLIFLGTNTVLMVLSVPWILPRLEFLDFRSKFKLWLGLESLWAFLMVFCFFKWITCRFSFWNILPYENSTWLQPFFCVVCALAIISKVFFPEMVRAYELARKIAHAQTLPSWYGLLGEILFVGGVFLLLYIPKPQEVTALSLVWDQWDHLDLVTGWFIKHGWYIGYERTVQWLVLAAIAYSIGLFYFIRLWLGSWLLAGTGAILAIKMGLFYYGSAPCIWINPGNTFLAHGWDIFLFFGLWFISVHHPKRFYLAAAGAGVVLILAWFKSYGYIDTLGYENQPLMAPLRVRQFFPYFMGYFVPLFYTFSLIVLRGQKNARNAQELKMPIVLCLYGLMIFTDYLERPAIGYYGPLAVPAILLLLWWFKEIFSSANLFVKRGAKLGILILAMGALLTNRLMLTYPNVLFQDKDRFRHEQALLAQMGTLADSSALIQQLTQADQKVVLLSNFETVLLMQAHRQPLFGDFPVMFSNFGNNVGGLRLKTKKQCLALINQMADENSLYVFIDQRLLSLPPQALGTSGLNDVLTYIKSHYKAYAARGFLAAYQRL